MRRFTLINANGARYDLNNVVNGFLHSVAGLGYQDETEYQRIGNYYKLLRDYKEQLAVTGEVHFAQPNAQQEYQAFIKFTQLKPLLLEYQPENDSKSYLRSGTLTEVVYDEKNPLSASVTFMPMSLFYEYVDVITYPGGSDFEDGKIYDYTYNYRYRSTLDNQVIINSQTMEESPIELTFYGPLVNPVWTHYVNGVIVATGKLNTTIPNGNKFVVDTTNIPYSIKEYNSNNELIQDLYQFSDFGTQRFMQLEYGQNSLTIADDESNKVIVQARGVLYYASV